MPGLDGIKTADLLRKQPNPAFIIFLTSHTEYMPEAFKVRAFRYLTKPLDRLKLKEAMKTAEEEILSNKKIAITTHGITTLINLADIICFEAYGDGTYIHTIMQGPIDSTKTLKYWIQTMDTRHFFQTHRSYLVSLRHIKSIDNYKLYMNHMKQPISISRKKLPEFKNRLNTYIKENANYL